MKPSKLKTHPKYPMLQEISPKDVAYILNEHIPQSVKRKAEGKKY